MQKGDWKKKGCEIKKICKKKFAIVKYAVQKICKKKKKKENGKKKHSLEKKGCEIKKEKKIYNFSNQQQPIQKIFHFQIRLTGKIHIEFIPATH